MIVKKVRPGEDGATNTRDAYATLNRLLIVGQLVLSLNVISTLAAEAAEASLKFAGVPFSPGSTVRANVPLSAEEKSYSGQDGNPVPQSVVAVRAISNVRIEMISSIFIGGSDSLKAGCCWRGTARNMRGTTRQHGVRP